MLIRIVKMSFEVEKIQDFLSIFTIYKEKIRNFKGCNHLELLKDKNNPSIYFTYSYWDNEKSLEMYRNSDLFKGIWAKTKVSFNDRPEAWSIEKVVTD